MRKRKRKTTEPWKSMAASSETDFAATDLAVMNLVCALDLPGSESLNVASSLQKLNAWARHVKQETGRNWHRYERDCTHNGRSSAQWQVLMMITVLQQDCEMRYNPQRIYDPDFTDSRDQFIHGIMFGDGGTCASMPVLYVAVGRRLGYPLKLVSAKAHLFARWDADETFNIEGSGQGTLLLSDEHYHKWPLPLTPQEVAYGKYLRSMNAKDELATFLAARGHCLHDNMRLDEASEAYKAAVQLSPDTPHYREFHLLAVSVRWQTSQRPFRSGSGAGDCSYQFCFERGRKSCIIHS